MQMHKKLVKARNSILAGYRGYVYVFLWKYVLIVGWGILEGLGHWYL
jgi:hypothetical protein